MTREQGSGIDIKKPFLLVFGELFKVADVE
jgi:hypothetical protein